MLFIRAGLDAGVSDQGATLQLVLTGQSSRSDGTEYEVLMAIYERLEAEQLPSHGVAKSGPKKPGCTTLDGSSAVR